MVSRTVKHPDACHRPRCGICHQWKRQGNSRHALPVQTLRATQDDDEDE